MTVYEFKIPFNMRMETKNEFTLSLFSNVKIMTAYQRAGQFFFLLVEEADADRHLVDRTFCAFVASQPSEKYHVEFDLGKNRDAGYVGGDHCLGSTVHFFEVKEKEKPK